MKRVAGGEPVKDSPVEVSTGLFVFSCVRQVLQIGRGIGFFVIVAYLIEPRRAAENGSNPDSSEAARSGDSIRLQD